MREKYENLINLFPVNKDNNHQFDDDGFKTAIKNACRDMTPRTMKLKNSSVSAETLMNDLCKKNKNNEESFFGLLKAFFNGEFPDFDEWHTKACESIIYVLNKYYQPESVTYGKAQKVVNITMKWICCLNGAEEYYNKGYFNHCHMALDSFTLEWIYRKGKAYIKTNDQKIARDNFTSWSNLSNDNENRKYKNGKIVFTYQEIQEKVREICKQSDIGMTPFEAEFYVWKQMQLTLAAEALFDEELSEITKKEFKNKQLKDKIIPLIECMKNINFDKDLI